MWYMLISLFKKLGSKFYSINDVRGVSSRGPDPTIDYLNELCMLVISNELDLGFAFDLDGDRLVVVNGKGEKLSSDATLLICIASAINLGMKKFVTSIDTTYSRGEIYKGSQVEGLIFPRLVKQMLLAKC